MRALMLMIFGLFFIAVPIYAIDYGTNLESVSELKSDGANVRYGVYWVGAWMDRHGWSGYENALETAKEENVTPIIIWFYWGDQISPENVESEKIWDPIHGVYKSKSRWYSMANELADITKRHMGDKQVIIVVENEFNKNGMEQHPNFNDYMIDHANIFRSKLNATLVVGFGNWYHVGWSHYQKTIDNYDMIGFQMLRGSTRNSDEEIQNISNFVYFTTNFIKDNFGKDSVLFDIAISSYPEPEYETKQNKALRSFLSRSADYENNGLKIIIYREIIDNVHMSEDEYFGKAEKHWGLKRTDGTKKSAYKIFIEYTQPERSVKISSNVNEEPKNDFIEAEIVPIQVTPIIENNAPAQPIVKTDELVVHVNRSASAKTVGSDPNERLNIDPFQFNQQIYVIKPLEFVYKLLQR